MVIMLFPKYFSFSPPCGHTVGLHVPASCVSGKKKDVYSGWNVELLEKGAVRWKISVMMEESYSHTV